MQVLPETIERVRYRGTDAIACDGVDAVSDLALVCTTQAAARKAAMRALSGG